MSNKSLGEPAMFKLGDFLPSKKIKKTEVMNFVIVEVEIFLYCDWNGIKFSFAGM